MKKFDIFISHSKDDRVWAQRFADALKRQGLQVWLDEEQLIPGKDWASAIIRGLEQSQDVVTVVDPKDLSRPSIYFEAGMAIGLGKEVTFIVPEEIPFDIKRARVVKRRTPDLTAKELLYSKKVTD